MSEQGARFKEAKGSYMKVYLNGKQSVLPMHEKEVKPRPVEAIKKEPGLK